MSARELHQRRGYQGGVSPKAAKTRTYPLRKVVASGVGAYDARPYGDVDVLECGHVLSGAKDMIGRRWPSRRRCRKCSENRPPEVEPEGEERT